MTQSTSAFDLVRTASGAELTSWVVAAADALQDLHDHGGIHAGITPATILVESDAAGRRRARLAPAGEPARPGTRHCAPELAGDGSPTPASDVYSLAASLFTLLAKHPPPPPNAPGPFPDPAVVLGERGIPDGIAVAVRTAMSADPSRRPAAGAFAAELRAALTALAATLPQEQTHGVVEAVLSNAAPTPPPAALTDEPPADEDDVEQQAPEDDAEAPIEVSRSVDLMADLDPARSAPERPPVSEESATLFEPVPLPAPVHTRTDGVHLETDLFGHEPSPASTPSSDRPTARGRSIEWLAPVLSFSGITMLLVAMAITVASLA